MPLSKCPRCEKLFEKVHSAVCPKCQSAEDADYDKIRTVLDRVPNLNAEQVAVEADVPVDAVLRMLDQGLISNMKMATQVKCGMCGAPAISISKKLCQACLEKLNARIAVAQSSIKSPKKKNVQVGEFLHARKGFEDKRR